MGVLNKKQKSEEDKMRTNEESFNTQVPCALTKVTHTQSHEASSSCRPRQEEDVCGLKKVTHTQSKLLKEKLRELESFFSLNMQTYADVC